jgi:hypothetical protein
VPERLDPGISASACQKPMTHPSVQFMSSSRRACFAVHSAAASTTARTIIEAATTYRERRLVSMACLNAKPNTTTGRVPTRTNQARRDSVVAKGSRRRSPSTQARSSWTMSRRK